MFKKLHNQAKISFKIKPITPLLIQSGQTGLDPTLPDMRFIRTKCLWGDEVIFIPGSSLKGVIRSHAEKLLRTMKLRACEITTKPCEQLYDRDYSSYRRQLEVCERNRRRERPSLPRQQMVANYVKNKTSNELPEKLPYAIHCYACRTFGSTSLSSRVRVVDTYPWRWNMSEEEQKKAVEKVMSGTMVRPGVAIDRRMGSVSHGPFDFEVVTGGTFYGDIVIRNFQLWQLALVLVALRDIDEGYQQLGYGKSRGLGRVSLNCSSLEIESYGHLASLVRENKIAGVGEVEDKETYDLIGSDFVCYKDISSEDIGFKTILKIEESDKIGAFVEQLLKSNNWNNLLKKGE